MLAYVSTRLRLLFGQYLILSEQIKAIEKEFVELVRANNLSLKDLKNILGEEPCLEILVRKDVELDSENPKKE